MGSAANRPDGDVSCDWSQLPQAAHRPSNPLRTEAPNLVSGHCHTLRHTATRHRSFFLDFHIWNSRGSSGQTNSHAVFVECLNRLWPHGHQVGKEVAADGSDGIPEWLDSLRSVDSVPIRLNPADLVARYHNSANRVLKFRTSPGLDSLWSQHGFPVCYSSESVVVA